MDEITPILHQLGGLFLGSAPTAVLFLLVLAAYRVLVYGPLTAMLAERRKRTLGTVENASASAQMADAKAQEYEARLRAARLEIHRQREERLQQWQRERDNLLKDARHAAGESVKEAKASIVQQTRTARATLATEGDRLAGQILSVILPPAGTEGAR